MLNHVTPWLYDFDNEIRNDSVNMIQKRKEETQRRDLLQKRKEVMLGKLKLPKLRLIIAVRVGNLVLLLILEEIVSVFHH